MSASITFTSAEGDEALALVRELFREYEKAIGVDLEYQAFATELANLPSPYLPPQGALLIVRVDDKAAGCVALRRLDDETGEMKRLYVRPAFRGFGLGRQLVEAVIQSAGRAGYAALRLDTLATMQAAQQLYRELGFVEIPAYNNRHLPGTRFYERKLDG